MFKSLCISISFISLSSILFLSCSSSGETKLLEDSLMVVHDTLMVRNDSSFVLKKRLELLDIQLDSLKKAKPQVDIAVVHQQIQNTIKSIDSLDQIMTSWMDNYDADFSAKTDKEAVAYLKEQKNELGTLLQVYNKVFSDYERDFSGFSK